MKNMTVLSAMLLLLTSTNVQANIFGPPYLWGVNPDYYKHPAHRQGGLTANGWGFYPSIWGTGSNNMPMPMPVVLPVHCTIKKLPLLAQSVSDCEKAGGRVKNPR